MGPSSTSVRLRRCLVELGPKPLDHLLVCGLAGVAYLGCFVEVRLEMNTQRVFRHVALCSSVGKHRSPVLEMGSLLETHGNDISDEHRVRETHAM